MYNNEKVYSIELGEDLDLTNPPREQPTAAKAPKLRPQSSRPASKARPKGESKPPGSGLQFAPLMILTWLLGPFSVHLQARRLGWRMLAAGMISGMAGLGMYAGRGYILDLVAKGWPLWPWVLVGLMVAVVACSVWAIAAHSACTSMRLPGHKLPSVLRRPWVVGVLGLVAPGLGLLLAGCARRGAAVVWLLWPVAASVLVLFSGFDVWALNQSAGDGSIPAGILEISFILAVAVLGAGLVGWVAQALEGARQVMGEPGIRHRMRGDWYAAALVFTLLGMAVVWDPTVMARQMDHGAVILQEKGFRVIPLQLSVNAHRLDPAQSEYAVRAIELYEDLGRRDEAVELRQELDGNLASYLALVHMENNNPTASIHAGRSPAQERQVLSDQFGENGMHRPHYQAR